MSEIEIEQARRILTRLRKTLQSAVTRDPEQEVRGIAISPLDQVISTVRNLLPSDSYVSKIDDVISVESIDAGEPIRSVDALLVVEILLGALPPRKMPGAAVWSPDLRR